LLSSCGGLQVAFFYFVPAAESIGRQTVIDRCGAGADGRDQAIWLEEKAFYTACTFCMTWSISHPRQSDLCVRDKAIRLFYDGLQDEMQQRTIKIECVLLPFRKSACNDISGISQGNAGMLQAER